VIFPRFWRLWQEPRPNTVWTRSGLTILVWYVEGPKQSRYVRVVHWDPPAGGSKSPMPQVGRERMSLEAWRCWWVFAAPGRGDGR
jgi:hypothetical protein